MATTEIWTGAAADNDFTTAANYESADSPDIGDAMIVPDLAADTTKNIDGGNFVAVTLTDFIVERNCFLTFGSRASAVLLDTDHFRYEGAGRGHFSFINMVTEAQILNAPAGNSDWSFGLDIFGGTIPAMLIDAGVSGDVALAGFVAEALTVTQLKILSGAVTLGPSFDSTLVHMLGGTVVSEADPTTASIFGGNYRQRSSAPTTLNVGNARVYFDSTAVPTTVNTYAGAVIDFSQGAQARTWGAATALNVYGNTDIYDPLHLLTWSDLVITTHAGTLRFIQ